MKKLAIITTHPIQYYSPVFKLLHQRQQIEIKVFYTWGEGAVNKFDPGFGKTVQWDLPLLDGYPYEWVINTSKNPGSHSFNGIITPGLIQQIKDYAPDAILIYGWAYASHLKVLRHFKNKIPIIFRGDSTLLRKEGGFKALLKFVLLRWIYTHVNHALYVGTNNNAYFKKYGLKEQQLSFAPHAIDNERFAQKRNDEVKALRDGLGLDDNDILILFAGKFEDIKSPFLLLDAFQSINKENVHLLLVGNGALENELKLKAAENPNIHFMGFQNQSYIPVVYQACDLFCLPSKSETWGLAINEAMVCQKAVLASDKVGCAIDLILPGNNGAIFKESSLADLVLQLNNLVEKNTDGLKSMGKSSKQIINDWNFEKQAQAIEKAV
ncbi:Glycosyltransferase involved in cell wall bisynthesis [Mucilaginibacter mallensis]|uniref:Glycosyltransferase involved in cell wall bisynthesis n=1 Tax=Mucilaginibacter mallensis TaxID=652787 RepID=A0A1H2B559_MUCMA|nr:glycosyltransferase family 4 protein [Mucilaginibacter mallensis]SDT53207.1 Glycosyltransferase involved in cell wall bisynthesis [Mucilaginibacter mallensis]